jgi:nitrite reductase (NADH) large subunit
MRHVIVGTGIAGTLAAETIRKFDSNSSITMIGGEPFFPYCRPMISMLMEGSIAPEEMAIRETGDFRSRGIELLLGESVQEINTEERELETVRGKVIPFDRLLVATGANPVKIEVDGCDLANIFSVRSRKDVENIVKILPNVSDALVVGGGLVGLKAGHALTARGIRVTMVEKLGHVLPLVVDGKAGAVIAQKLSETGIVSRTGGMVTAFDGNGQVQEASLNDGSTVSCDLVIVAVGSRPAVSLLEKSSIKIDEGVQVNSYLETCVEGVYAAGDVAQAMDVALNRGKVTAVWPVAAEQGIVAGMNMAGRRVTYRGSVGRNVVRIEDLDILTGGVVNPQPDEGYEVVEDENRRLKTYRKLVFKGDVLKGVVMLNQVEKGGVFLSMIQHQIPVTLEKEQLLDPNFDFCQLMPD